MAPRATPGPAEIVVTQIRSAIGTKPKHRATLRALGLRRVGHSNVLADRPEIRGMLSRVSHLVSVTASSAHPRAGHGVPAKAAATTKTGSP
jgi:large subunit ribosomal protein L30